MKLMKKFPSLSNLPTEPLGTPVPFLSNYYRCPKCDGSVEGEFGIKSAGNSWAACRCQDCGYEYKVKIERR